MLLEKHIPFSYVLNKIRYEIVYIILIGLITYFFKHQYGDVIPDMPLTIPVFIGTAISVLLSFKINQSYDRWWEARKIWGSIVNDSRSLVLQLQSFLEPGTEKDIKEIAYRHMAWCYSLGQSLRGLDPLKKAETFLSEKDLETIRRHNNKPLAILQLNTQHIAQLRRNKQVDIFGQITLNKLMVNFSDYMGMAERIKSTVFPATYRYFLHWIIYLFVVPLSIALGDIESYFELPLLLVISSAFFLVERSATHLQDPFSNKPTDTAMTAIATTIEINMKQMLKEKNVPEPYEPNRFYLM